MFKNLKFNRLEFSGSLGDLGALLPIAIAMVMLNGLNPVGLFFSVAVFYIIAGLVFGVTVPVQPMKVIGAYAIATGLDPSQIVASSLIISIFLLIIGLTGAIDLIRKYTPPEVIKGVQFSTGVLLISGGIKFIFGISQFQIVHKLAEPALIIQNIGFLPIGILLGCLAIIVTFLLLNNKKYPAGLVVISGGVLAGVICGARLGFDFSAISFSLPEFMPYKMPDQIDFSFALLVLVLPQIPMTLGNAIIAYSDLSKDYFGEKAKRITNKNVCYSMALANLFSFLFGGMPMCHGSGGLAAHYRFGARTAGSNIIIGLIFLVLSLFFGEHIISILSMLPLSVLGALLIFAGAQLASAIFDLKDKKHLFVAITVLAVTLVTNLAAGFFVGIAIAKLLKWDRTTL